MIAFVARRIVQSVAVLLAVGLIAFAMANFLGDPVEAMVGQDTSQAERARLREQLGLDRSVAARYVDFIANALRGDFGRSYRIAEPVGPLILSRLPATLELSVVAALLALLAGIPAGIWTALHPDTWSSRLLLTASLIGISLPTFLFGILLIYIFAVQLDWLPSFGRGEVVRIGWWTTGLLTPSGLKSLILPAVTLGLFQMTLILRLVRAEMMEVLRSDFIRFARARGLRPRAVHFRHALRNALGPVVTITGLQLGAIIAFAIITEAVFQWPGVGLLFLQSVQSADIPVMASYLLLVAAVFVAINLIVDLIHFAIDPRLRDGVATGR